MPGKEPNTMMIKILGKKEYASVSSDALDVLLEVHDGKTTSRRLKKLADAARIIGFSVPCYE